MSRPDTYPQTMQPIQITTFQALRRSLSLIIKAAPIELRNLIILNIIRGAAPSGVLVLDKLIIDEVSRLLLQTQTAQPLALILSHPILLWSIVGVLTLKLVSDSIETMSSFAATSLRDRVQGGVEGQVLEKVANFDDIALFENPELLNILELAKTGVKQVQQLAFTISMTITGICIFIPSIGLAASIAWWVPVVMVVSSLPSIHIERKYLKLIWRVQKKQAKITREMNLSATVLTGEEYAKELRLFGLQELWLKRWNGQYLQFFSEMQQVRKKGAIVVLLWSIFSRIGVALPFVYVVMGALGGRYTLGDLALYSGLIVQVETSLQLLIGNYTNLYDISLGVSPIFQLLDLKPELQSPLVNVASRLPSLEDYGQDARATNQVSDHGQDARATKDKIGIEIKDLSFCYPGSTKSTIANIDLTINPGEMLVLVGENGAGKTTLGKLLGRLYDPTSGTIAWNGKDLRSYPLAYVRSRIAVVMQDYARFPSTVRENVGFGDLLSLSDDTAINEAISEAGISAKVNSLSAGLETPLGKQLEDGIDLSGGQWQRIAIARALMRLSTAEVLIFDEPTAALDPKTEHEIYSIFRQIAAGKTTIVISHRLGLAKIADRIAVMENGKIVEIGTHDELIELGEIYHSMFTRQASSYI
ncbi:MAG: ABC transporter ATP-binding protein [Microcoleus sp. PH2017_01_SCD_O_A]|uniref:ABC transporter ATP-binding protein n=2 Tax=Microcoleus TaxID=44471 RepID=UPI001D5B9FCB|nr:MULTISPECIES: ABC transporter ATP-binding protein [unclassified Microcoleus]MCC3577143.1 ABC transporter ATP-binding protein [Microcoleus sp. PH2017_32_RDM_D_A]MCC3423954.1 ABC transporter ATP-binding protein [Microcoleus sp. PH2017_01_SCD_O_A]MCC3454975.1 ABC transporter ATP-binding protein [Microcoleus sp. PH2017_08_TRC_O_A]MCC3564812.1 ABC transporter ATP-binding protein [Microcoleus sp. PH2017_31_RDM_U_A]MCC3615320.1 ABC transporter ATP-binding protein [Microcoleus sp. PH2017_38_RDM_U_B